MAIIVSAISMVIFGLMAATPLFAMGDREEVSTLTSRPTSSTRGHAAQTKNRAA